MLGEALEDEHEGNRVARLLQAWSKLSELITGLLFQEIMMRVYQIVKVKNLREGDRLQHSEGNTW